MDKNDVTIRAYSAADKGILSSIWYLASLEAHGFLGEARLQEQRRLIENIYLEKAETWVACLGGEPAGFIGLLDTFVGGLFVAPSAQGTGIGRRLIAHALALKGQLMLEVYADNGRACAFYRQLGFREISRRARDDDDLPFENILMRLDG